MTLDDPRYLLLLLVPLALSPLVIFSRRYFSASGAAAMVVLRLLVVSCLALAAGGLVWKKNIRTSTVLLVVDHSHSVDPTEAARREEFVNAALSTAGARRRLGVLAFGARPVVMALPSATPKLEGGAAVDGSETDIESALRAAMAYLPPTGRRRVVLLSDGLPTQGDALAAAESLAAAGIEVSTLPLAPAREPDVAVVALNAPARRKKGEPLRLSAVLDAEREETGVVRFYEDGQPIAGQRLKLKPGQTEVVLDRLAGDSGLHTYEAVYDHPQDTRRENNRQGAFTYVEGPQRVLLAQGEAGGPLSRALAQQGMTVSTLTGAAPGRAEDLLQYGAVVLDNLPAQSLAQGQMRLMKEMVHGLGRGLVMLGGRDSFGPGGYHGTPIAQALPVSMRLMSRRRVPSLALVFVVDKSGSMADFDVSGLEKLALAREAVTLALEVVLPGDTVGVVGFDSAAKWVLPAGPLKNRPQAQALVRTMQPGGGTDMYPGLQLALQALSATKAMYKHVVVLSDGMTNPADFESLLGQFAAQKITLSAVGIGQDADRPFLEDLARLGEGRVYFPTSAANLPQLFTRETTLAYRAYLVQERFTPRWAMDHEALSGFESFPPLEGYTGTSPKATAQHVLITHKKDPLLSLWRHGTGRAVAFTSDSGGRWAADWVQWPGFGPFFAQLLRWAAGEGGLGAARLAFSPDGVGGLRVEAKLRTPDGHAPLESEVDLRLLDPSGKPRNRTVPRASAGEYRGRLGAGAGGVFLGRVGARSFSALAGAYVGSGAEYAHRLAQESVLGQVMAITGGRELTGPENLWEGIATARPEEIPLWPWLLVAAGLLWIFDVALRRFNLQSRAVQQAVAETARRAAAMATAPVPVSGPAPRTMDSLLKNKHSAASLQQERARLVKK